MIYDITYIAESKNKLTKWNYLNRNSFMFISRLEFGDHRAQRDSEIFPRSTGELMAELHNE